MAVKRVGGRVLLGVGSEGSIVMNAWRQKGGYGPIWLGWAWYHRPQRLIITRPVNKGGWGDRPGRADVKSWLASISFMLNVQLALSLCWHELQDKAFRKRKCSSSDIKSGYRARLW